MVERSCTEQGLLLIHIPLTHDDNSYYGTECLKESNKQWLVTECRCWMDEWVSMDEWSEWHAVVFFKGWFSSNNGCQGCTHLTGLITEVMIHLELQQRFVIYPTATF